MPLVNCETCTKDVADSAEVCPHCGQDQPEKYLRKHPKDCLVCPGCNVNNYAGADVCRNCGKDFDEVRKDIARYYEKQSEERWWYIRRVIATLVLALIAGWLNNYINGWFIYVPVVIILLLLWQDRTNG